MKYSTIVFATIAMLALASGATAHHSFAIYDMTKEIPFEGVVRTLNFKNPHIEMTLTHINDKGEEEVIDFVEGAPANMLVRQGLKPDMIKVGTKLTIVGCPRKTDPDKFFIRKIILENGKTF